MKYDIPAILFAGGKSSRMGKDKALLPFGNYNTLSEYQYHRLKLLFSEVHISAKENKFDFNIKVIYDTYKENSPLIGIISVFETLKVEKVFILSVDAPFVNASVINTLIEKSLDYDAVIAQSPSGEQPLCGIYSHTILPVAKAHLKKGDHRISNLLKAVKSRSILFKEDVLFTNLNYPQDYVAALKCVH